MFIGLFLIDYLSPFSFVNDLQTKVNIFLTKNWITYFDIPVKMDGAFITYEHPLKLEIVNECNGLVLYLLLASAYLSYPISILLKSYWIIFSYFIMLLFNTIRLDWIIYYSINNPQDFEFMHNTLGRYIFAIVPLILFYTFARNQKNLQY